MWALHAGECAAQVGEGLYRLKGLSGYRYLHLVVLVSWSLLKHYFGLLGADGETKAVAG